MGSDVDDTSALSAINDLKSIKDKLVDVDERIKQLIRVRMTMNVREDERRRPIEKMSDEVVHSNPYSRLMALQKMGIVDNYESIRKRSIAVVGVGGVGGCAAEMLTRCGIGKLLLFDYDLVEMANMNRMFFQPKHVGMAKVEAASDQLKTINPDVLIDANHMNISSIEDYKKFVDKLQNGGFEGKVDLVLSCVDNYEARMTINKACNLLDLIWMESGVSETGIDGHIQLLIPGITACFACVPPLVIASGIDEKTLKREGVCAASLPTTMSLIAGLLVQNALKFLLKFGIVSTCLSYSGATNHFQSMILKPNPVCFDENCVERQNEKNGQTFELNYMPSPKSKEPAEKSENEWMIELVEEQAETEVTHVDEGLKDLSLDDLQSEFNSL